MRREKYLLDPRATPYPVCWVYKPFISAANFGAGCPRPPTEQSMPVQLPAATASCENTMRTALIAASDWNCEFDPHIQVVSVDVEWFEELPRSLTSPDRLVAGRRQQTEGGTRYTTV